MNIFGWPVRDAEGRGINYSPEELAAKGNSIAPIEGAKSNKRVAPKGFAPAEAGSPPFWQYAIFGSGIGLSNIIIGPAPASGAREIIIGGNSGNNFNELFLPDNFWQVIRRNSATGDYDHLFVSPIYSARVKRIATSNVLGDSQEEIVVMLADGRIYFYDRATRRELGSINTGIGELGLVTTGIGGLEGLSLADLDGDGVAEIIVTTANDLFVFNGAGSLLWKVAGAGGFEVVVGQMDNDPALEIATTKGSVVDAARHALQWKNPSGFFGNHLKLSQLPGSSYQQLIAAQSAYWIYAYDVAAQQQRWSIHTAGNIDALEVADVDNDGIPEVLFGDSQFGQIHVYDLITQTQKWAANNPEYGVTNIAVGDVDNDGVADLLWGAGWTLTGPDYLYIASTTGTHAIKWQSVDLQGPFLGPAIGDLDGDGQPELVLCSTKSGSTYSSGRMLVFDATTMALRAISAPIGNSFLGVRDLKLRDLENDGRMEILLATDFSDDGAVDVYSFDVNNTFTVKWRKIQSGSSRPFNVVEAADLDGNGTPEIIAGNAAWGFSAATLYTYDYPYALTPLQYVLSSTSYEVSGLVVGAFGETDGVKVAALGPGGDLYTLSGKTRALERFLPQTGATLINRRWPSGLITADSAGVGHFLQYTNTSYAEDFTVQLGSTALGGINMLTNGELWTGVDGRLSLRLPPSYDNPVWESSVIGTSTGRYIATDHRNGQNRIYSSAPHAVAGFVYESPLPFPTPTPSPAPTPTPIPVNPNNILVSIGDWNANSPRFNGVREFTPTGALVQTIPFNYNNQNYPQTEYLRDIIVEEGGTIASYNGTFTPLLTRCSLTSGTFSHTSHSGWSTINNAYYGSIAAYHNFIYVIDMNTASPGEPNGIVRFDTSINLGARFASGSDFTRLDVGLDGKLYAYTNQSPTKINVYNPVTMVFIRQITLPSGVNVGGFAVDQTSRIFVCSGVQLFRFDSNGTLETSKSVGVTGHGLTDIAIDNANRVALVEDDGRVFLGDTTLANSFTSFSATSDWVGSSNGRFSIAFARPISGIFLPPTPTPTPTPAPVRRQSHRDK